MKKKRLNDIVAKLLGAPYALNCDITNPSKGINCFGMIRLVLFSIHGVMIDDASQEDYETYIARPELAMDLISFYLQPYMRQTLMSFIVAGDVVGKDNTAGVYTGNGNFLCAVTGDKVQILPVKDYSFDKVFTWAQLPKA